MTPMLRIVTFAHNNFRPLLSQMQTVINEVEQLHSEHRPPGIVICFDFQNSVDVKPATVTIMVAFILYLRRFTSVQVQLRNCTAETHRNLRNLNFFIMLGLAVVDGLVVNHGLQIPIEVITASKQGWEFANKVTTILESHHIMPLELRGIMTHVLSEVIGNVFEHAESSIGTVGSLSTSKNGSQVEICIVDCGAGIPTTLRNNPQYASLSDEDCLKRAIQFKVTDGKGQGMGLFYTSQLVEKNGGRLSIYGNTGHSLQLTSEGVKTTQFPSWRGTLIHIVLKTNVPVRAEDIFGNKIPVYMEEYVLGEGLW